MAGRSFESVSNVNSSADLEMRRVAPQLSEEIRGDAIENSRARYNPYIAPPKSSANSNYAPQAQRDFNNANNSVIDHLIGISGIFKLAKAKFWTDIIDGFGQGASAANGPY